MSRSNDPLTVNTHAGTVRGRADGQVRRWLGIPYAAAPIGPLRFQPPTPHPGWTGIRDATTPGHISPQSLPVPRKLGGPRSEDCLLLNITAPLTPGEGRPVMVWIHGGAFLHGCGSQYNPASLVTAGDLIVVTINYRLGPLGFVDFSHIVADAAASNLGLRDQIAALQWVHDNIAAFGGDPARVTMAGESAGAVSVASLLLVPQVGTLTAGAIAQSGSFNLLHSASLAADVAARYAEAVGLKEGEADKLQQLPSKSLRTAQRSVASQLPHTLPAAPWFDGDLLPASLAAAADAPTLNIPLLAGTNRDESTFFSRVPGNKTLPTARPDLEQLLSKQLSAPRAHAILEAYPDTRAGNTDLATDFLFGAPVAHLTHRHSQHSRTWHYRLDARNPMLGATHGIDLVYLFDYSPAYNIFWRGRTTPQRTELQRRMRRHWVAFVQNYDPGDDWPPTRSGLTRIFVDFKAGAVNQSSFMRINQRIPWGYQDVAPAA